MSTVHHGDYLRSLGKEFLNSKSSEELAQIATDFCGYSVNEAQARGVRTRLNKEQGIIKTERSLKGQDMREPTRDDVSRLRAICEERGLPFDMWRVWWDKTKESSIAFYNKEEIDRQEKQQQDFLERIKKVAPAVKAHKKQHLRALIPANFDVHIGKMCEEIRTDRRYTPDEAVRRVLEGHAELYELAKPMGITDVILPLGNDLIHVDNNKNTTTNGTPQDAYGSVESMTMLAVEMYIRVIEQLAKNHHVWLAHVSSNHDRVAGWQTSQIIAARFWNDKRVHFNRNTMANTPRKYFIYGRSLIMFQHGDSKVNDVLGTVMAEVRPHISETDFTYCYQGDKHHKMTYHLGEGKIEAKEKDYNGVTVIKSQAGKRHTIHVETVRSPSEADSWHTQGNYINIPAVEAFVHDVNLGQIARFTHWF